MTNAQKDIIRKWSKLRTPDKNWKRFEQTAITLFMSLQPHEQKQMLDEFDNYIRDVKSGRIDPSPVEIKIPVIKQ